MSQFTLIAYDAKEGGFERRMACRAEHLAAIEKGRADGTMLCGAAITDGNNKMIGSILITNFPSRAEFDKWLASEPFVINKVWENITVLPTNLAPPFADLIRK